MDINLFPLEVLQEILSFLSYGELKVASLVCHRWNQASEKFIVRKGQLRIDKEVIKHFDVIRKSSSPRNYRAICIARMDDWKKLQAVVSECIQRFPNARKLRLAGVIQNQLGRFYQTYRVWMGTLESLEVSLDDTSETIYLGRQMDYILELPNLKKLRWMENLTGFGQKTVTIKAPKLEYVYFEDSCDYTCELIIAPCEQIKHIRGTFCIKHFDAIFEGVTHNLECLILDIFRGNCQIDNLSKMHQLRCLLLRIGSLRHLLQEVESMRNSKLLKVLIISSDYDDSERGTLNLKQIFANFNNLETLDLCGIDLTANEEIQADQLVFLKLCHVTCSRSIFELNAPKLKTVSLTVEMLNKLQLNKNEQLSELYVDLESSNLKESLDQIVLPFINGHNHIRNLTLILTRRLCDEDQVLDDVISDCIVESVEHLVLYGMDVGITFFRLLAGWKSLKSLKLHYCTINCSGMPNDVIRLPGVERMTIERVTLRGTSRIDFPILLVSGTNQEIVGKWNDSELYFSTLSSTDLLSKRKYKFRPFSWPVIEPLLPHWLL